MENVDYLLSDQFVEFSKKINEIHLAKKEKKKELKALYEQIQEQLEELNQEALALSNNFEMWKNGGLNDLRSQQVEGEKHG